MSGGGTSPNVIENLEHTVYRVPVPQDFARVQTSRGRSHSPAPGYVTPPLVHGHPVSHQPNPRSTSARSPTPVVRGTPRSNPPVVRGSLSPPRSDLPVVRGSPAPPRSYPPVVRGNLSPPRLEPPVVRGNLSPPRLEPPVVRGNLSPPRSEPPVVPDSPPRSEPSVVRGSPSSFPVIASPRTSDEHIDLDTDTREVRTIRVTVSGEQTPAKLGPPVPCGKASSKVPMPTIAPNPLSGRMPPVASKPPFSVAPEKDKVMQGYMFLGKLESYILKSVHNATDSLRTSVEDCVRTNIELTVTVRDNMARIAELERAQSVNHLEARVKSLEDARLSDMGRWRDFASEKTIIMERIEMMGSGGYTKQEIDEMMEGKLDCTQYESMKANLKTTLTEFDRLVKLALETKADKTNVEEVEKECARIWKELQELIVKVDQKMQSQQDLVGEAIKHKADKVDVYSREVIDAKLRDKLDVPFSEQIPYEVSFVPEETFSVDMLPERSIAIPIPDTIPSKATHVQMSVQFHLTDHVSMCRFTMSTFRTAVSSMDNNTKSIRVSWLSDALKEVLWTFRINGRYGRTIFARWSDERPQWQMIREWASHYSCRAIVKAVAWEVYDEESQPIAGIKNVDYDPKVSLWRGSDLATQLTLETKPVEPHSTVRSGFGKRCSSILEEDRGNTHPVKFAFNSSDSDNSPRGPVFSLG